MTGPRPIPVLRNASPVFWVNLALKVVLIGLLVFGAFSGLQQFEGKGYLWRLASYPIATLVVPIAWRMFGRRPPYPYPTDMLLTLPFLVDTAGNALDLYDTIVWWDDANHFVNWALLSGAVGTLALRHNVGRWTTLAFVVGFGAVAAILWEIGEYFAFIRDSSELDTAYAGHAGRHGARTAWLGRGRPGGGPGPAPAAGVIALCPRRRPFDNRRPRAGRSSHTVVPTLGDPCITVVPAKSLPSCRRGPESSGGPPAMKSTHIRHTSRPAPSYARVSAGGEPWVRLQIRNRDPDASAASSLSVALARDDAAAGIGPVSTPELQLRTLYRLNGEGRIVGRPDPEPAAGPLFCIIRGRQGCAWAAGADVPEDLADELRPPRQGRAAGVGLPGPSRARRTVPVAGRGHGGLGTVIHLPGAAPTRPRHGLHRGPYGRSTTTSRVVRKRGPIPHADRRGGRGWIRRERLLLRAAHRRGGGGRDRDRTGVSRTWTRPARRRRMGAGDSRLRTRPALQHVVVQRSLSGGRPANWGWTMYASNWSIFGS